MRLVRVLVAVGDGLDLAHHERLRTEVGHDQEVAGVRAAAEQVAVDGQLVVARLADIDAALEGRLNRAGVHAVVSHLVQPDPGLARGLVEGADGRHIHDDVGRDGLSVGGAGEAGEHGGHQDGGQAEGLDDAAGHVAVGHGFRSSLNDALVRWVIPAKVVILATASQVIFPAGEGRYAADTSFGVPATYLPPKQGK